MKILQMSAYFDPEQISSSHLTEDLFTAFAENKIEVEDYVPMPCRGISKEVRNLYKKKKYEEKYNGFYKVYRFSMYAEGKKPLLRAVRYFLVNMIQYHKGAHAKDIDLIFAASTPPTQGLLCCLVKKRLSRKCKRNIPFIYNLQDVFPDSLVNTGMTHRGSLLWKIGRVVENYTYKNADKIIVISDGFKKNIMEKGVPEEKIKVISNWIDLEKIHPVERSKNSIITEFKLDPKKFIVVYAGNFGAAQGADVVLDAAEKLKENSEIQFVIFGGGAYYQDAVLRAEFDSNVFIHELLPENRVSEVYSLGDIALITCKKGTGSAGLPSKTWSIMACNTPIIASFDTDGDLATILKEANAGECVIPEDADALCSAIMYRYEQWRFAKDIKLEIRSYIKKKASKESCVQAYIDCIKDVSEGTICVHY